MTNLRTHHTLTINGESYQIPPLMVPLHRFSIMTYDPFNDVQIGDSVEVTGWKSPLVVVDLRPRPDYFGGVVEMVIDHA